MSKPKTNFLSKLELQGFKSFGNKTVFEFPERITCIVGPNGSGKSNVIDAIRWVLGERESKNLRGSGMENLIFSGTPKKAASGIARVDLFFNNQEKLFPLDAEEVVLSRRVNRSGISEIYLNDAEIKLKDLLPLLAKMRLGARGITIIGQGQSDIFVASSPSERREMIEEVLGLKEFRIKKIQSERRLENSLINMEKIKAALEELAPQVRVYKKQKARLEKREEVEKELKDLEKNYFAFKYQKIKEELKNATLPLKKLWEEKKLLENEIKKEEEELNKFYKNDIYDELKKIKEKINALWDERSKKERELFKIEAKLEAKENTSFSPQKQKLEEIIVFVKEKIEETLKINELEGIKKILNEIKNKIEEIYKKEEKQNIGEEDIKNIKDNLQKEIKNLEEQIEKLRKEEDLLEEKTKTENLIFKEKVEKLNDKKNKLYSIEGEIQKIQLKEENLKMKMEDVLRDWNAIRLNQENLENITPQKNFTEEELKEAEIKITRLRNELLAIGEIDENVLKEFENAEQKFNFLSQQLKDLEKAVSDLKTLIKNLDERIKNDFKSYFKEINLAFDKFFKIMFNGGRAHLVLEEKKKNIILEEDSEGIEKNEEEKREENEEGVEIELNLPRKKIKSLSMLSGGEKTLVSLAALFALISVSPPPFLVLDEIDAALDEENARRFAEIIKEFSEKTQFLIVTHNRATMEAADVLYGITMGDDGVSKVLSLKIEEKV